jgi:hypothetical protein
MYAKPMYPLEAGSRFFIFFILVFGVYNSKSPIECAITLKMTLKTIKKCRREDVPTGVCVA